MGTPRANNDKVPLQRRFLRRIKSLVLRSELLYRASLRWKFGAARLSQSPGPPLANATLKSVAQWQEATERGKKLHVPVHRGAEKNWDHLAAVSIILANTTPSARILDAGAEIYSNVLPALFLYGYHDLHGINLSFTSAALRGPIRYVPGDLTHTPYPDTFFDAITCLSVVEHGVPLREYFREMFRVLKPGGLLITSTDYFPTPIDTAGKVAHGTPIKIFTKPEIEEAVEIGKAVGFKTTGHLDLECEEKPIRWDPFGLEYTFVMFTLRKPS